MRKWVKYARSLIIDPVNIFVNQGKYHKIIFIFIGLPTNETRNGPTSKESSKGGELRREVLK